MAQLLKSQLTDEDEDDDDDKQRYREKKFDSNNQPSDERIDD
jgi:hypothetical protein